MGLSHLKLHNGPVNVCCTYGVPPTPTDCVRGAGAPVARSGGHAAYSLAGNELAGHGHGRRRVTPTIETTCVTYASAGAGTDQCDSAVLSRSALDAAGSSEASASA
jgi:hypothetical protein